MLARRLQGQGKVERGLLAGVAMENISADPGEKAHRVSRRDMSSLTA